jgi:hypothetical protein
MKKQVFLMSFMGVAMLVAAQENSSKFSMELGTNAYEQTMTEYEADKTADAVVLFEEGDFYFRLDTKDNESYYTLIKNYNIKIKVLQPSGVKQANFAIPVFKESEYMWEKFYIRSAKVFNLDNNNLKLSTFEDENCLIGCKNVKEEAIGKNWVVKKFTLPDVKVGSIILLQYTIETPFIFSFDWQFQKNIPVVYSKIRYRTIPHYSYTYRHNSDKKLDEYNEESLRTFENREMLGTNIREKAFTFGMKDLPAFKENGKNDMLEVAFQLKEQRAYREEKHYEAIATWKEFSSEILAYDDFGKYLKQVEKEAKNILPALNLTGKTPLEKMQGILDYVKSNYQWNGIYGKYVLRQLPDFLQNKNGNAANINLFLAGMLKQAGVNATPVLINRYGSSDIGNQHPYDNILNYVVIRVITENSTYYLDAAGFKQNSELTGFVAQKNSKEWVKIEKIEPNTINNLKPIDEQYDSNGEFSRSLNTLKKVFYFE